MYRCTALFGGQLGFWEIVVIAAVGLLLFGSRLPQVGRSLGRSIVQFKKGLRDTQDEIEKATDEDEADTPRPRRTLLGSKKDQDEPPAG